MNERLGLVDCKKIKQTVANKEEFQSPLIEILFGAGWTTREDMIEKLHVSDRRVRNLISELSMFYPVCFDTSGNHAGYYLPSKIGDASQEQLKEDLELVQHTIDDLLARVEVIHKRLKPLYAYKSVAERFINDAE